MVSAHIQKNTIINEQFDHSSFIKTMCKKWNMKGLTDRDKSSLSFEQVFTREKREWPPIDPPIEELELNDEPYHEDTLNDLQYSMLVSAHAVAYMRQKRRNPFKSVRPVKNIKTVKEAMEYLNTDQMKKLLKGFV